MKISLTKLAKENERRHVILTIQKRLPEHIHAACQLSCDYWAEAAAKDYILLMMKTEGKIEIVCQRCLQVFFYDYRHETQLAVCSKEMVAERLMDQYECVVSDNYQVDLTELLTDELHLHAPEKHFDPAECDGDIKQYIHDII
ncbi:YceD family protein [Legionella oakridgensis]|uniref:Metal-binding protein n=2 Tax=Legionella oakridgensis TaxID=29423 RepID=A0A0W0WZI8_9GAMM|nr:YceD family protein [Legionella oakridgensis]AHE66676.1 putative metal-binding, possibly nucleic acid-binding protein [Legionella oakridgensis ATCC 33761 = DSM 21215]ETO93551.1 putative metal-binding, possibly nucleic acid-binding protein [Legionella oakridgensis RV-2-2007]KTD37733.1 metal-binding protein [Legionella oakridgensis]STY19815.1 metal-binding, possibly nucleic acid-binding protein [Legionella longbeachae]